MKNLRRILQCKGMRFLAALGMTGLLRSERQGFGGRCHAEHGRSISGRFLGYARNDMGCRARNDRALEDGVMLSMAEASPGDSSATLGMTWVAALGMTESLRSERQQGCCARNDRAALRSE